jgi:hypothetical protein
MRGKMVDMEKLSAVHELTPAVGNMKINARGDLLGPTGNIVKKREDVVAEYYETNPKARVQSAPKTVVPQAPAPQAPAPQAVAPTRKQPQQPTEE